MTVPQVWRRSALEAAACLYRYKKLYLDGVDGSSDPSRRGTTFHAAAELYIRKLVTCRVTADIDLAREAWLDAVEATLLPTRLVVETEQLFFRWAEGFELSLDDVLLVEETLVTLIAGERFTWRPDLVYARGDEIQIWDWKTHFAAHTEAQAKRELQGKFYLLMARTEWPGFRRYRFFYRYVRLGLTVPRDGLELYPEDVDAVERQLLGAVAVIRDAMRRNTWPAQAGPHCGFCRLDCPINGTRGTLPVRVDTRRQFAALANEYMALRQRTALLGEILRTYVVHEGPQVVNGARLALKQVDRVEYPLDEVLALLDERGMTLPPEAAISQTALGPLVDPKKYPLVADDLRAVAKRDATFRFEVRKDGEIDLFGDPR
jgi:hypothetical protein